MNENVQGMCLQLWLTGGSGPSLALQKALWKAAAGSTVSLQNLEGPCEQEPQLFALGLGGILC